MMAEEGGRDWGGHAKSTVQSRASFMKTQTAFVEAGQSYLGRKKMTKKQKQDTRRRGAATFAEIQHSKKRRQEILPGLPWWKV